MQLSTTYLILLSLFHCFGRRSHSRGDGHGIPANVFQLTEYTYLYSHNIPNKKLGCRRETARRPVSLEYSAKSVLSYSATSIIVKFSSR